MTPNQLRARLLERNTNMRQFALKHQIEPRTVQQTVHRYVGTNRTPRGLLTWRILKLLSREIDQPVIDGLDKLVAVETEE
jgi:hypothetical protein